MNTVNAEYQSWELLPHDADIGVRGYGRNPAEAFEQAGVALSAVISDPDNIQPIDCVEINCRAPDIELLFADWLNALVYEMSTRHMLFSRFEVEIHNGRLTGTAWGEPVDIERHRPRVEVKGATYTDLHVEETAQGWKAQCVVDV